MEKDPKEKQKKEAKEEPKETLEEFSGMLIKLGEEIGQRLKEKKQLEEQMRLKQGEIRKLEQDVFSTRTKLARLAAELERLEARRREFAEKKFPLEGE